MRISINILESAKKTIQEHIHSEDKHLSDHEDNEENIDKHFESKEVANDPFYNEDFDKYFESSHSAKETIEEPINHKKDELLDHENIVNASLSSGHSDESLEHQFESSKHNDEDLNKHSESTTAKEEPVHQKDENSDHENIIDEHLDKLDKSFASSSSDYHKEEPIEHHEEIDKKSVTSKEVIEEPELHEDKHSDQLDQYKNEPLEYQQNGIELNQLDESLAAKNPKEEPPKHQEDPVYSQEFDEDTEAVIVDQIFAFTSSLRDLENNEFQEEKEPNIVPTSNKSEHSESSNDKHIGENVKHIFESLSSDLYNDEPLDHQQDIDKHSELDKSGAFSTHEADSVVLQPLEIEDIQPVLIKEESTKTSPLYHEEITFEQQPVTLIVSQKLPEAVDQSFSSSHDSAAIGVANARQPGRLGRGWILGWPRPISPWRG